MHSKKIQKAIERGQLIPHEEVMKSFSKEQRENRAKSSLFKNGYGTPPVAA